MHSVALLVLLAVLPSLCLADLSTAPITTDWIPKVSRKMVKFAESQTGALQMVKAYDEKLNFTEIQIDGETQLHLLTQAAGDRLKMCRDILHRNKAEIEASHAQGPTGGAPASDCCDNLGQLEYDPRFLQQIVNDSCATFTAGNGENTIQPPVYDTMKSNIHDMSGVTWQYYGAKQGEYHQFPKNDRSCEGNDHRFRNWYVSAASPKKKNVVIVMDVSGSMEEPLGAPEEQNRLNLAKQAALTVLDTLTPRDWGGVVSFSARAEAPVGCLGDSLGEANPTNIGIMRDFIKQRVPETITVYAEGFRKAFDMFHEAKNKKPEQFEDSYNILIFLTDGQPTDTYFSLDDITKGQDLMERSVHIFTYGLGANLQYASSGWANDPNNPWVRLPALDFLATIADQNNQQIPGAVEWTNRYCTQGNFGSCFSANRDPQGVGPVGRTEYIDDSEGDKLKTIMGSYYDFFPFSSDPEPTFSVPTNDEHLGLVINAALPTIDTSDTFFGVTAVDISMDVVFHEIANFNIGKYSYAFLVDREDGRVLIHRNLPKPTEWRSEPTFLGLEAMEGALRSREVTKILNGDTGDYYTMVKVPIAHGNAQFDGPVTIEKAATFYYKPIPDTKYSVVLCLFEDDETITIPTPMKHQNDMDNLYHRLDLLYMNNATGDTEFCSLYGEYATPDESTIKFPPEAFADPINYLNTLETFADVVDIELFINDFAGFVANPGLLDYVQTDVVLSAEIERYWRENGQESVWRYFGTENGVFRIFPGVITDKRYNPTRQTWYARALSRPEDYTFSRPVPSPFGGGNMVTISRVISHTKTEEVLGVIAADITETYYYSMLYTEIPECLSDQYDCFLLDDSGYFIESLDNTTIYYLSTFNNNTRNMEHDHLAHRFPWLAKYLTVRGEYLRSEWCNNYATQNAQLFYDTSGFTGLEVTTGPPCYQFALYPINATNTFILTLQNRQTYHCDDRPITVGGNQNCSCNDICQTCSTDDLQVCQCPCICDWNYESCTNEILRLLSDIPCPTPQNDMDIKGEGPPYSPGPEMQGCEERCSAKSDNITCEALSHCDWCEDSDFPACRETCLKTTLAPVPAKTTTSKATAGVNTPHPLIPESETAPTCTNEYMELALPDDRLTHVVTSGLHWDPDPSCKATFNGTHYILRTGLYQCGTKARTLIHIVTFDTKYVIFYNSVNLLFTHDGVITRDPDVVIHSICKYERDEVVLSEFLPIPGGLEFVDEGFGQLSIRLDLFHTQSYLAPYTTPDYPVHYHLRDRMYLQLQVQGHARQLSVIALHCESTSGRNTSLQYPLIQDGCPSDNTLQLYTTHDPATQRFSLEAFRFVQEVTTIHIRCEVEVCLASDTGSRCAQGCKTSRHHKRSLEDQGDMKSRYVISRGPIILDVDFQPGDSAESSALVVGGSVVMIALIAVLLAVTVRRSKRVHPGYQRLINLDVDLCLADQPDVPTAQAWIPSGVKSAESHTDVHRLVKEYDGKVSRDSEPFDNVNNPRYGPRYPPGPGIPNYEGKCSAQFDNITCKAVRHCDWCEDLDVPVCRESCVKKAVALRPHSVASEEETEGEVHVRGGRSKPVDPLCAGLQCPTLAAPVNGALRPAGPHHCQDVVTFTCNQGYELDGAPSTTCQANLTWSHPVPTCRGFTVDCSTMPAGMYPDPLDCTMFYQCLAGNAHLFHMPCAPGTLFDWNIAVCTLTSHCTTYIDECTDMSHTCSPDASCTNTVGSFDCICNSGYNGNGFTCTDDNECADGSDNCSPQASCTNTVGSFTCACTPGYSGDGVTCTAGSVVDCGPKPAGMYPDPHDCTKFYQCTGDPNNPLPVHKDCAPGTLFDWNINVCTLTSHCTASATLASETPTNAPPTALLPTDAQITAKPTPEEDTTDVAPTKGPRTTLQQTVDAAFGVTTDHSTLPQTTAIVTKVVTESTFKPLHSGKFSFNSHDKLNHIKRACFVSQNYTNKFGCTEYCISR
ncbi:CACHD1 [Branchiostoma lanceolatum]|uniref:chitinase n=1 Tax=Branchiostoma lanceolatum TaxID=7740 RepID=A0A8J9ZWV3_BRALA|nr:CACHD1 [Branchiostoma lanceolatum]